MVNYKPEQGDIIYLNFDPQAGHEQKGRRPALVVSNRAFYDRTQFVMVCPVTNRHSGFPTHIVLEETTRITGEVMCEQVKCLDLRSRNPSFQERAPEHIVDLAIDIISSFMD